MCKALFLYGLSVEELGNLLFYLVPHCVLMVSEETFPSFVLKSVVVFCCRCCHYYMIVGFSLCSDLWCFSHLNFISVQRLSLFFLKYPDMILGGWSSFPSLSCLCSSFISEKAYHFSLVSPALLRIAEYVCVSLETQLLMKCFSLMPFLLIVS